MKTAKQGVRETDRQTDGQTDTHTYIAFYILHDSGYLEMYISFPKGPSLLKGKGKNQAIITKVFSEKLYGNLIPCFGDRPL